MIGSFPWMLSCLSTMACFVDAIQQFIAFKCWCLCVPFDMVRAKFSKIWCFEIGASYTDDHLMDGRVGSSTQYRSSLQARYVCWHSHFSGVGSSSECFTGSHCCVNDEFTQFCDVRLPPSFDNKCKYPRNTWVGSPPSRALPLNMLVLWTLSAHGFGSIKWCLWGFTKHADYECSSSIHIHACFAVPDSCATGVGTHPVEGAFCLRFANLACQSVDFQTNAYMVITIGSKLQVSTSRAHVFSKGCQNPAHTITSFINSSGKGCIPPSN